VYVDGSHAELARIVRHELVHVRQIGEIGAARFYWRWIREYASMRMQGIPWEAAYRRISFEAEAFAAEEAESV